MKKNTLISLLALVFILLVVILLFSQADIIESTGGIIIDVSYKEITISEYDIETDTYKKVVFLIDKNTEIIGVESIDELSNNDIVEIEYTPRGNKNIALSIFVEEFNRTESNN